jgi:hypothetical protein
MKLNAVLLMVIVLWSCENHRKREIAAGPEGEELTVAGTMSYDMETSQKSKSVSIKHGEINVNDRKLIKNGALSFESKDIEKTKIEIERICRTLNGYIANENGGSYGDRLHYEQHIRIPHKDFERFVQEVEHVASRFESKNIVTQDVTEEFVDIEARLKTKKDLESRYLELLKIAKTVEDMLSIESQIGNVRSEIESMEGRLNLIKNQISFSTLTISYYELTGVDFGFAAKFVYALKKGWENLLHFLIGIVNAWPFLILSVLILYLITKYKRSIFPRVQG